MRESEETQSQIARLDEIENVTFKVAPDEKSQLVDVIASAVQVASELARAEFGESIMLPDFSGRSLSMASTMALQSVNALLSAASVKCNIRFPEEEIEQVMTAAGDIIYRCGHTPDVHEWDLMGHRRK